MDWDRPDEFASCAPLANARSNGSPGKLEYWNEKREHPEMTIESILRRRAFRDGFHDGRRGCPMRRLATRRARWLYALGRIFANVAPADVRIYERRQVTEAAVAAFAAMPARY